MSNNTSSPNGGIGFVGLLTIAFVVLKLTNTITWPWWWVLSPIWITIILVVLIFGIVVLAAMWIENAKKKETPEQKAARLCRELANRLKKQ